MAAQTTPTTAKHAPITTPVVKEKAPVLLESALSEAEEPNTELERFDESPLFLWV